MRCPSEVTGQKRGAGVELSLAQRSGIGENKLSVPEATPNRINAFKSSTTYEDRCHR